MFYDDYFFSIFFDGLFEPFGESTQYFITIRNQALIQFINMTNKDIRQILESKKKSFKQLIIIKNRRLES